MVSFITFTTYGTWLHGDRRGSFIRQNGQIRYISNNPELYNHHSNSLSSSEVVLSEQEREIVLNSIINTCNHYIWKLYAVHIRTSHVHLIISCTEAPENTLKKIKSYCTKALRNNGFEYPRTWTRHGSIVKIYKEGNLLNKACYVLFEQGSPMQWYCNETLYQKCYDYYKSKSGGA